MITIRTSSHSGIMGITLKKVWVGLVRKKVTFRECCEPGVAGRLEDRAGSSRWAKLDIGNGTDLCICFEFSTYRLVSSLSDLASSSLKS